MFGLYLIVVKEIKLNATKYVLWAQSNALFEKE